MEQNDAAVEEAQASTAFEKLRQDSQEDTDNKQQEVTDRVKVKAKLKVQINTLKETLEDRKNDMKAIGSELDSLHKQCDELLKFYDQRQKNRAFEISQLRDVKDVLSGSSVAVRTGLVEESTDPLQAKEDALMKSLALQ